MQTSPEIGYTYSIWSGAFLRYKLTNGYGDEGYANIMTGAGNNQVSRISSDIRGIVSTVTVYRYDPLIEGYVTVYNDENCEGHSAAFEAP